MPNEKIISPDASRELETAKDDFRKTAMKLFTILRDSKGEPAAKNTDAAVVDFARALWNGENTDDKISAMYESVSGGEEGAPEGALDTVERLVAISKKLRELDGK